MTVDRLDLSISLNVEGTSPVSSTGAVQGQTTRAEREQQMRRRAQQKHKTSPEPEQSEPKQSESGPSELGPSEEDQPQHRIDSLA